MKLQGWHLASAPQPTSLHGMRPGLFLPRTQKLEQSLARAKA
jgi:hypothetical protein